MPGLVRNARAFDRAGPAERRAKARASLQALLRHALLRSRFYGRSGDAIEHALEAGPDDEFFRRFAELPPLTKADLDERFDSLVTDPEITLARVQEFDRQHPDGRGVLATALGSYNVKKTSGTSGRLVYVVDRIDVQRRVTTLVLWRSLVRVLAQRGLLHLLVPFGRPLAALARRRAPSTWKPPPGERLARALRPALLVFVHRGNRSVYLGATGAQLPLLARLLLHVTILAHDESLQAILERTQWLQPELLFGLPSRIEWLARAQLEGALSIAPDLVYVGGETLHDELFDLFRRAWPGAMVLNTYGATETKPIALACAECGELHVCEDLVHLELCDEAGGEAQPGRPAARVFATSLWNFTMPVLRYEMADSIEPLPDAGCAWRTRRIRVRGREPAFLWVVNGRTGDWLPLNGRMLKERLVQMPEVRGFRVRHPEPRRIELDFVVDRVEPTAVARVEAGARGCLQALLAEHGGWPLAEVLPQIEVRVFDADGWNEAGGKLNSIHSAVLPPALA